MVSDSVAMQYANQMRKAISEGGPRDAEGLAWYVKTLRDCPNEGFLRDLTGEMINEFKRFPSIADVRALLRVKLSQSPVAPDGRPSCSCCGGWEFRWYLAEMRGGRPVSTEEITEEQYNTLAAQLAESRSPSQGVYQGVVRCPKCGGGAR